MFGGSGSVQAAGQMKIYNGKVKSINNSSGHYQPSASEAGGALDVLPDKGVDLSGTKSSIYNKSGETISAEALKN